MNDSDLKTRIDGNNTYHATTNLNTAIENPQVNINNAVGVNIQSVDENRNVSFDNNSYNVNQNVNMNNNQFSNYSQENYVSNNFINSSVNVNNVETQPGFISDGNSSVMDNSTDSFVNNKQVNKVSYEPTLKEKKKPKTGFEVSKELKVMIFIVFILFLVVLVIPYVYDFFKDLQLVTG